MNSTRRVTKGEAAFFFAMLTFDMIVEGMPQSQRLECLRNDRIKMNSGAVPPELGDRHGR